MRFGLPLLMVPILLATAAAPARGEDALVEKVRKSIRDGKGWLLGQQRPNGSWEISIHARGYPGGETSLALLALLTAGESPHSPAIQKGLDYLRGILPTQTYVVGLQTMVFAQAGEVKDRTHIERNVKWLIEAQKDSGWSYHENGARTDSSNTQYAVLGLHAAIEAGVKVDKKALERIRKHMLSSQAGGGWSYQGGGRPIMTMTCAGLCNLMITGMDLDVGKQQMEGGIVKDCGKYDENRPVADALRLIGAYFPAEIQRGNPQGDLRSPWPFYCLYGIERTGRLTGRRFFGGHDWYEIGCRYLVSIQKADGYWQGANQDGSPVLATSFALLFLAKGQTPVLITKLAYGPLDYDGWNNKHHDTRHLVEFASRELFKKMPLAWQIFDVRSGVAADSEAERRRLAGELLPSPIVYLNGHGDARFSARESKILQEYIENGGFVLAECCCGAEAFRRRFEKLIDEILPGSELWRLPDDHPIWTASGKFLVTPNKPFPLYGVQHGCKWVAILSPRPMAYYWEGNDTKSPEGRAAFELAANIIAYATGLEPPRPRLTEVVIPRDDSKERVRRGYLKVGQLRYTPTAGGDWRPAPKAMRHLMSEVRKAGIDVLLEPTPVYPSVEKVVYHRFLYMHGRSGFTERAKDLEHLHFNLTSGGLLLADACCGSPAFDAAFRKFMETLWAKDKLKLEPVPLTDELFSAELNGQQIRTVRCRRPRADGKGVDPEYRELAPALEGIKYNGRWVVLYSKYDLGCALEGNKSSDCLGHDYDSAVRLGRAAVLYALKR
ncbi:MAG TPA: DUF4159 domain-containing protein [Gemmataceae bacterium]|nr:DUF4159 domain-containing protein [Gemmataceae bacterium]